MQTLWLALLVSLASHTAAAATPMPARSRPPRLNQIYPDYSVGFVAGYIDYKEPGIMREYGGLYGVNATFQHLMDIGIQWNGEGELIAGKIQYDGGTVDGSGTITPKTEPTMDYIFNFRGTLGWHQDFAHSLALTPYLGLGYRDLNDKISGDGSYNRNIAYIYVPIGAQFAAEVNPQWTLIMSGDFDWMVYGTVVSNLSEASSFPDLTNHNRGIGGRLTATLRSEFGSVGWHVGALYQKWKIQESDHVTIKTTTKIYQFAEPENESDFLGINAGLDF